MQAQPMERLANLASKFQAIADFTQSLPSEPVYACDACNDTGWTITVGEGAKLCECEKRRRLARMLDRIPAEYRGFDLATIEPMTARHEKQAPLLVAVKANPMASLFLSGKNGCGKSLVGWLSYKRAVQEGRPAVFLTMSELLRQFRELELDSEKLPVVDAPTLSKSKLRWLVVLDEAEKARPTEFASEKLCDLLDAIYRHRHQLIVTSNFTAAELREHWSKQNPVYGNSIMRRIMELDGLIDVPMF